MWIFLLKLVNTAVKTIISYTMQFEEETHRQTNKNKYFTRPFSSKNVSVNAIKHPEWSRSLSSPKIMRSSWYYSWSHTVIRCYMLKNSQKALSSFIRLLSWVSSNHRKHSFPISFNAEFHFHVGSDWFPFSFFLFENLSLSSKNIHKEGVTPVTPISQLSSAKR